MKIARKSLRKFLYISMKPRKKKLLRLNLNRLLRLLKKLKRHLNKSKKLKKKPIRKRSLKML